MVVTFGAVKLPVRVRLPYRLNPRGGELLQLARRTGGGSNGGAADEAAPLGAGWDSLGRT